MGFQIHNYKDVDILLFKTIKNRIDMSVKENDLSQTNLRFPKSS